jgi:hypothetical protein
MTQVGRICTLEEREQIIKRDLGMCRYCGSKSKPFHIDHVYPYSAGGVTKVENLVTSCQRCNFGKHKKIGIWPKPIGYFLEKRKRLTIKTESLIITGILFTLSGFGFLCMSEFIWTPRILISIGLMFFATFLVKANNEVLHG